MTDDENKSSHPTLSLAYSEHDEMPPPEPPRKPSSSPSPQKDPGHEPRPGTEEAKEIHTARNLIMVGSIAGPVSLFIGGVLLSTVGAVCAFLGLRKVNKLTGEQANTGILLSSMRRSATIALVVCGLAIVLNGISSIIMFPIILEAVQNGDYGNIMPGIGDANTAPGTSSTWG